MPVLNYVEANMEIHGYGVMIALGVLCAGAAGKWLCRRCDANFYDLLLIGAYGAAFGMIGAKLLYLLQNIRAIDWMRISEPEYLKVLLSGGFVFYGGLLFGVLGGLLAVRVHHLPAESTIRVALPLLPLAHGFGRIGCQIAGCCHGICYQGPAAVIYSDSLAAPNGVPLFPVQTAEALLLFLIAAVMIRQLLRGASAESLILLYVYSYGAVRFSLEFLRGDAVRGGYGSFSTSQWISLLLLAAATVYTFSRFRTKKHANTECAAHEE